MMLFGGIRKECYKSGSSISLIGGICGLFIRVFPTRSHTSCSKVQVGLVVGSGSIPALDGGGGGVRHPCRWNVMEQICSFQRLAVISKSNISGRTINGVLPNSLRIPTFLKIYDFSGTKIQLATMVSIIACPALWECFLSVAAFLLLSLLFSPPAPEAAAWLTHHWPRH